MPPQKSWPNIASRRPLLAHSPGRRRRPLTARMMFGSKRPPMSRPSASPVRFSTGQKLSASVLSLIVAALAERFRDGHRTPIVTLHTLDVAFRMRGKEGHIANLIRMGIGSRFVQTRRTPLARQGLIPNLSRDAAAFLVWNCRQLHISSAKLARPFESALTAADDLVVVA